MAEIARIVEHIERAARALHPVIMGDDLAHREAAHTALNALAAARLLVETLPA
jgi:hypothetical protein